MSPAAIPANDFFGAMRPVHAWAPGRVNLLGEHTAYNDGYMLPVATPQRTGVLAAPSDACGNVGAARFGEPINESHYNLRDDYEVSIAALDELTEVLRKDPDVHGARLTGAMHVGWRLRGAVPHRHGGCRGTARRNESQRRRRRRDAAHSRIHPVTTL